MKHKIHKSQTFTTFIWFTLNWKQRREAQQLVQKIGSLLHQVLQLCFRLWLLRGVNRISCLELVIHVNLLQNYKI